MVREQERFGVQLGSLIETSGRVQASVGKIMRWGLASVDMASGESNRDALLRDLDDLKAAVRSVERVLTDTLGTLPVAPVVQGSVPTPEAVEPSSPKSGASNGR